MVEFLWDEPKRLANLAKHGLDFADVALFHWDSAVMQESHSGRFKAVGRFANGTAVVIFATLGAEAIFIVSFRPANAKERKLVS